jgi:hypothetical protein
LALSISFLGSGNVGGAESFQTRAGWRGLAAAGVGSSLVFLLWLTVRHAGGGFLITRSAVSAVQTGAVLGAALGMFLLVSLKVNSAALRRLWNTLRPAAVVVGV